MDEIVKKRIMQVLKGEQNAFEEIVDLYKHKIFQLCYRMLGNLHEAEDAAQEVFIKAYMNISSFKLNLKFSTWLYRIATNLCIDRLRKRKPDYFLDAEIKGTEGLTMYSHIPVDNKLPEEEILNMEIHNEVHLEISKLPEKYRSVIILKYIEELSLKEISEILNLPLGTVKTRVHRGREQLRNQLRYV